MKKAASAFGIIIGIVSVIMSIITFNMYEGPFESAKAYGGDAYTGIQQAAAQSANNIVHAAKILRFGLGSVLLILGLGMIVYFAMKLGEADTTGLSGVGNNGIGAAPSFVSTINQKSDTVIQSAPAPSPAAPVVTRKPERPRNDWVCPKCGSKNSRLVTKCMNCDALKDN